MTILAIGTVVSTEQTPDVMQLCTQIAPRLSNKSTSYTELEKELIDPVSSQVSFIGHLCSRPINLLPHTVIDLINFQQFLCLSR